MISASTEKKNRVLYATLVCHQYFINDVCLFSFVLHPGPERTRTECVALERIAPVHVPIRSDVPLIFRQLASVDDGGGGQVYSSGSDEDEDSVTPCLPTDSLSLSLEGD